MNKYPTFKKGQLQRYYTKLSDKEKNIIEGFLKYISITSKDPKRQENNRRNLTIFRFVTDKELDNIKLEDLRGFLGLLNISERTHATKNDLKASVKRFLKWRFKDWSERFDNFSDIKMVMRINEKRINADTLIKKEEVEKIVKAEPNLYWKAFFITLYESGLRPNELRNIKWSNIKFNVDGDVSEINIFATKTHRARSVYVKEATWYLQEHKKKLQYKLQDKKKNSDWVFPAQRNLELPLSKGSLDSWFTQVSKRVLGRSIFPYMLRHSRATELYTNSGIPDKIVQKFLGHSSSMSEVYTHLSNKDVKEALGKTIYNLEDLPPEKRSELERKLEEQGKHIKSIEDGFVKYFLTMLKILEASGKTKEVKFAINTFKEDFKKKFGYIPKS